jgi:hypothetical protein
LTTTEKKKKKKTEGKVHMNEIELIPVSSFATDSANDKNKEHVT